MALTTTTTNPNSASLNKFFFSVDGLSSSSFNGYGEIMSVTSKQFPVLNGLSLKHLVLETSSVHEPHWYTNANALGYCLFGKAAVTIIGNSGDHDAFTISDGEMFYVPCGYLHHIENIDNDSTTEIVIALSHESPEYFSLSRVFGDITDVVLGNTFQLSSNAWSNVVKCDEATVIGEKHTLTYNSGRQTYYSSNKYKFNIENSSPSLNNLEGSIRKAWKTSWPVLDGISMSSLRLSTTGMREPHWNAHTAEMGYVVEGHARITILSATGDHRSDTFQLESDDMYFVPRAYPHYIENIGTVEVKILIFYDQSIAGDIGFTGSFSAYSREVLAATLQCSPNQLPVLPFYPEDLVIVKCVNPVDT